MLAGEDVEDGLNRDALGVVGDTDDHQDLLGFGEPEERRFIGSGPARLDVLGEPDDLMSALGKTRVEAGRSGARKRDVLAPGHAQRQVRDRKLNWPLGREHVPGPSYDRIAWCDQEVLGYLVGCRDGGQVHELGLRDEPRLAHLGCEASAGSGPLRYPADPLGIAGELVLGPVKTRAGRRDLPLLGLADEALMIRRGVQFPDCERFGDAWTDNGMVFTTRTGLPIEPRNLNRSFERICDSNGIRRVRMHALRHTAASLLKAPGVPAKDVQVILGHAHVSTTNQIYTHVDQVAIREAIAKLNRPLGGDDE